MLRNSPLPLGLNHLPNLIRLRDTQLLLLQKLSNVRSKQKEVSALIKANLGDKDELIRQAQKMKKRISDYEVNLNATEEELLELGLVLPNWSMEGVPLGVEENAVEIERFGPEPILADVERDHLRTANYYGLLDNEASTISTGSSWPYLRGTLALLEMALINYATSICVKHGYEPVIPPRHHPDRYRNSMRLQPTRWSKRRGSDSDIPYRRDRFMFSWNSRNPTLCLVCK